MTAIIVPDSAAWSKDLMVSTDKRGNIVQIVPIISNIMAIFVNHPDWRDCFGFDEFAQDIVIHRCPPWREIDSLPNDEFPRYFLEQDTTRIAASLTAFFGAAVTVPDVQLAVSAVAQRHSYHPVREWLLQLEWDQQPRIHTLWAAYFGAEATEYHAAASKCFLLSLVARGLAEGAETVKVDTMPILEGRQGTGKSTGLRYLMPVPGWFSDTPIEFGGKDSYLALHGKWLLEVPELDGFDRYDARRIKQFCTSLADHYRAPYAKKASSHPRRCVFAGTTNESCYLTDPTGGRRFHPVATGVIDLHAIERDRDQLFAEAVSIYGSGAQWYLIGKEVETAQEMQLARQVNDPWEIVIRRWLELEPRPFGVTTELIMAKALDIPARDQTRAASTRVGIALRNLGWLPIGASRPRRYKQSGNM